MFTMNFQLETGGGSRGGSGECLQGNMPASDFSNNCTKKEKNKQHKYQEKLLSLKYTDEELQKCHRLWEQLPELHQVAARMPSKQWGLKGISNLLKKKDVYTPSEAYAFIYIFIYLHSNPSSPSLFSSHSLYFNPLQPTSTLSALQRR